MSGTFIQCHPPSSLVYFVGIVKNSLAMANSLKTPDPIVFSGDLAAQWSTWRRQFEWYLKATRKGEVDEEVLVGVLLTFLGAAGLKIYDTVVFSTAGND